MQLNATASFFFFGANRSSLVSELLGVLASELFIFGSWCFWPLECQHPITLPNVLWKLWLVAIMVGSYYVFILIHMLSCGSLRTKISGHCWVHPLLVSRLWHSAAYVQLAVADHEETGLPENGALQIPMIFSISVAIWRYPYFQFSLSLPVPNRHDPTQSAITHRCQASHWPCAWNNQVFPWRPSGVAKSVQVYQDSQRCWELLRALQHVAACWALKRLQLKPLPSATQDLFPSNMLETNWFVQKKQAPSRRSLFGASAGREMTQTPEQLAKPGMWSWPNSPGKLTHQVARFSDLTIVYSTSCIVLRLVTTILWYIIHVMAFSNLFISQTRPVPKKTSNSF